MPHEARISIAEAPQHKSLLIRCEGRCTMGVCPSIRSWIEESSDKALEHLYIELTDTEAIDSTFTGFLLSLKQKGATPDGPQLHLVAPSENVLRTLETMQVIRLLDIVDAFPVSDVVWTPLATGPVDPDQAGKLIVESHENLIDADERNREKFGRIVEGFRDANRPE